MQRYTLWIAGPIESVLNEFLHAFGGATVAQGRGLWKADNGEIFDEPTNVVDLLVSDWTPTTLLWIDNVLATYTHEKAYAIAGPDGAASIRTLSR